MSMTIPYRKLSLSEQEKRVQEMVRMVDAGYSQQAIADRFGVCRTTVVGMLKAAKSCPIELARQA